MNTLLDLLTHYATESGFTVDDREWLMLLEVDPARAAHAMTQLAILAAEDTALRIATDALDALLAALDRSEASVAATFAAAADVAAFQERMNTARERAWQCWTDIVQPLLIDATVLHRVMRPALPSTLSHHQ